MEYFDAQVVHIEKGKYSKMGNPCYSIIYRKFGEEETNKAKTESNAGFVYGISWHCLQGKTAKISLTKSGKIQDLIDFKFSASERN